MMMRPGRGSCQSGIYQSTFDYGASQNLESERTRIVDYTIKPVPVLDKWHARRPAR